MLHYFLFYKILTALNEVLAYKAKQFLSSTCYQAQIPFKSMLINLFSFAHPYQTKRVSSVVYINLPVSIFFGSPLFTGSPSQKFNSPWVEPFPY